MLSAMCSFSAERLVSAMLPALQAVLPYTVLSAIVGGLVADNFVERGANSAMAATLGEHS